MVDSDTAKIGTKLDDWLAKDKRPGWIAVNKDYRFALSLIDKMHQMARRYC